MKSIFTMCKDKKILPNNLINSPFTPDHTASTKLFLSLIPKTSQIIQHILL